MQLNRLEALTTVRNAAVSRMVSLVLETGGAAGQKQFVEGSANAPDAVRIQGQRKL